MANKQSAFIQLGVFLFLMIGSLLIRFETKWEETGNTRIKVESYADGSINYIPEYETVNGFNRSYWYSLNGCSLDRLISKDVQLACSKRKIDDYKQEYNNSYETSYIKYP